MHLYLFLWLQYIQNQNFSHNRIITFCKFISNYLQDFSLSVFHNSTLHPDSPMFLNLSHNAIRWVSYIIQRYSTSSGQMIVNLQKRQTQLYVTDFTSLTSPPPTPPFYQGKWRVGKPVYRETLTTLFTSLSTQKHIKTYLYKEVWSLVSGF